MTNNAEGQTPQDKRLQLFGTRCRELRDRVVARRLPLVDAVDMAQSAATWSGLVDDVGDDVVQAVMAEAFVGAQQQ